MLYLFPQDVKIIVETEIRSNNFIFFIFPPKSLLLIIIPYFFIFSKFIFSLNYFPKTSIVEKIVNFKYS